MSSWRRVIMRDGIRHHRIASAGMPIGTLTKNTQRQLRLSVRNPPMNGPLIGPIITTSPQIDMARACRLGALRSNIAVCDIGPMNADAIPCSARKRTISVSDVAAPQSIEDSTNISEAPMNKLRDPIRSDSQPVSGSTSTPAMM